MHTMKIHLTPTFVLCRGAVDDRCGYLGSCAGLFILVLVPLQVRRHTGFNQRRWMGVNRHRGSWGSGGWVGLLGCGGALAPVIGRAEHCFLHAQDLSQLVAGLCPSGLSCSPGSFLRGRWFWIYRVSGRSRAQSGVRLFCRCFNWRHRDINDQLLIFRVSWQVLVNFRLHQFSPWDTGLTLTQSWGMCCIFTFSTCILFFGRFPHLGGFNGCRFSKRFQVSKTHVQFKTIIFKTYRISLRILLV